MDGPEDLETFGQLIGFVLRLETQLAEFYEKMAHREDLNAEQKNTLLVLHEDYSKRAKIMERIKRENVNEMILERIQEVRSFEYYEQLETDGLIKAVSARLQTLEEQMENFYLDSAIKGKKVLAEVSRRLQKMADGNREHIVMLKKL